MLRRPEPPRQTRSSVHYAILCLVYLSLVCLLIIPYNLLVNTHVEVITAHSPNALTPSSENVVITNFAAVDSSAVSSPHPSGNADFGGVRTTVPAAGTTTSASSRLDADPLAGSSPTADSSSSSSSPSGITGIGSTGASNTADSAAPSSPLAEAQRLRSLKVTVITPLFDKKESDLVFQNAIPSIRQQERCTQIEHVVIAKSMPHFALTMKSFLQQEQPQQPGVPEYALRSEPYSPPSKLKKVKKGDPMTEQPDSIINHGLVLSRGELFLVLPPTDSLAAPDVLCTLARFLVRNPDVTAASGHTIYNSASGYALNSAASIREDVRNIKLSVGSVLWRKQPFMTTLGQVSPSHPPAAAALPTMLPSVLVDVGKGSIEEYDAVLRVLLAMGNVHMVPFTAVNVYPHTYVNSPLLPPYGDRMINNHLPPTPKVLPTNDRLRFKFNFELAGRKLRIGVLTSIWKRHQLTSFVMSHYTRLKEKLADIIDLQLFAVQSEGESAIALCEAHGWTCVASENLPLGRKWNTGLQSMRNANLDAVFISGSDDVVNEELLKLVASQLQKGYKFVGLRDVYALDLAPMQLYYHTGYMSVRRIGEAVGLARTIHVELLDQLQWKLWDDRINNTLDHSAWKRLRTVPDFENVATTFHGLPFDLMPMDIKLAETSSITSVKAFQTAGSYIVPNAQNVLDLHYDADFMRDLLALRKSLFGVDEAEGAQSQAPTAVPPAPALPSPPVASTPLPGPSSATGDAFPATEVLAAPVKPSQAAAPAQALAKHALI